MEMENQKEEFIAEGSSGHPLRPTPLLEENPTHGVSSEDQAAGGGTEDDEDDDNRVFSASTFAVVRLAFPGAHNRLCHAVVLRFPLRGPSTRTDAWVALTRRAPTFTDPSACHNRYVSDELSGHCVG